MSPSLSKALPRLLLLGLILVGCGGGGTSNPGTTAGTYTITVTGTSGAITASAAVQLTVQ